LNKPASGSFSVVNGQTNGQSRWIISPGDADPESTGNVGSNFSILRYADNGAFIDVPFRVMRANGVVNALTGLQEAGVNLSVKYMTRAGVVDGSGAPAGQIGEILTAASAGGTSVPNQTPVNVVTLLLSPGDWDVWGTMMVMPTVGTTQIYGSVSTVSATLNGNDQRYGHQLAGGATFGSLSSIPVPAITVSVSVPTNVYLVAQAAFASGTCTGGGKLIARRRR